MIGKSKWYLVLTILFWSHTDVDGYQLLLNNNSPVTTGSTVTLNATVVDDNGVCAKGNLLFSYEDDAFPKHTLETQIKNCVAIFYIAFDTTTGPSNYRYKVEVKQQLLPFIYHPITSGRGQLIVTENLNGVLQLFQNNTNISKNSPRTIYVSTNLETVHRVEINTADLDYLNKSANSTSVYWFVDCIYQENTTSYTFSSNYTEPGIQHEILGIVVANIPSSIPITTPTPIVSTTTVNPNNSTSTNNSTIDATLSTSSTTKAPSKTDVIFSHHIINSTFTSDCEQKNQFELLLSAVPLKDQQKYGYFSRSVLTKDPIANVKTQGKVWIQEGEMLNLLVNCNGSGPFRYCAHYVQGPYNETSNDSCIPDRNLVQCQMQFVHYFREPTNYTLIVNLANDVSKVVTPIGINIYKVQKQPQISVIVVPVTFSSIAVIIVVFGIAYYFQNRSRYMVEVADFDFANNSDMEYKTFRERLRDAISQAINRTQDYSEYDGSEEQIGNLATPQNQKYGSMQ
uniref:Transmembrane protein n=1 Tax=Schizaphis graminum TaxID=13262 RepID=A0A2S2N6V6_SCHGA